jgi:aspartyl-tRNA(Asn)/glutamyl-tRNA(Gln) amidotransferase subunit A
MDSDGSLTAAGKPDARDRLEVILARLEQRSAEERVFLKIYLEAARAAADASDARRRRGDALGPLDGRIVSIKDLFDVAGEPTTAGSVIRREAAAPLDDALVVQRLRQAGAVIIGKTNMTEFAFSGVGLNPHYGTPGNAYDASLIPGGSSSGAGVSVAEGTSEISIGSDTGGSVRIPAALNGVVGFKPTASRIPLTGVFPLSPSLDSVGPLAKSVADCALADAVMAGETPVALEPLPLGALRVGVPRGYLFRHTEAAVAETFARILTIIGKAGAQVSDIDIDDLVVEMRTITGPASIASIEASEVHADWLSVSLAGVDPRVSGPLSRRMAVPAWSYLRLMRRRRELSAAMDERLAAVDVLALPTTPIVAPGMAPLLEADDLFDHVDGLLLRNPQLANQFDLTAISLPMPDMHPPAGLMLMARRGEDKKLLAIAAGVEAALG